MRFVVIGTALILGLLTMSPQSRAGYYYDGSALKAMLDADDRASRGTGSDADFFTAGKAIGYILGVTDAFSGQLICVPREVKVGQVEAIVAKFLSANPEQWNQEADVIVAKALQPVFPCQIKSPASADVNK